MVGEVVTLKQKYVTRFGTEWPKGTELAVEQKVRQGWEIEDSKYKKLEA